MNKKITRVFVDITFEDDSTTFQHFTSPEGARRWLEPYENVGEDPGEDEEGEGGDSEKRSDLETDTEVKIPV